MQIAEIVLETNEKYQKNIAKSFQDKAMNVF